MTQKRFDRTAAGNGIDIMFSFDTTGSMYPCLAEVKRKLDQMIRRLFDRIPGLRVGVIAHGDYCDRHSSYVLKMLDLTDNRDKIANFVRLVGQTGGGDSEECYELVLHEARSATWRAGRSRVLVLIGDDVAHGPRYPMNELRLDWENEAKMLNEARIQVYAVQCLNFSHADRFYTKVAEMTGGLRVPLDQFRHVETALLGIAYRQDSLEALSGYEQEVRKQGPLGHNVEDIFDILAGRARRARKGRSDGIIPVDPSRFQVFEVDDGEEPEIREFVESMGIRFEKGRGFYR